MRNLRWLELRWVAEFTHNFNYRALTALCRNAWRRQQINPLLLVQSTNHNLELRISKHTGESENSGRYRADSARSQEQGINRISTNGEGAATIIGRNGKLPNWRAARRGEREIGRARLHSRTVNCSGGTAATKHFVVTDIELAEQPVEAKFFQIILRYLNKLRFDFDLLGPGDASLFNQGVHKFQIIDRIAHDKATALRQEVRTRSRRKWHTLAFQELARAFAVHQ